MQELHTPTKCNSFLACPSVCLCLKGNIICVKIPLMLPEDASQKQKMVSSISALGVLNTQHLGSSKCSRTASIALKCISVGLYLIPGLFNCLIGADNSESLTASLLKYSKKARVALSLALVSGNVNFFILSIFSDDNESFSSPTRWPKTLASFRKKIHFLGFKSRL